MSNLNKQSELVKVQVQVKRPRRFKAGSEMSSAVNLVTIDVEECGNDPENLRIRLTIDQSSETENDHCKTD